MRHLFVIFLFSVFWGLFAQGRLDYSDKANWLICENEKLNAAYDLFYVYPTLSASPERALLDRQDEAIMRKVLAFVQAQTKIVSADARVFAPFVRQMEYQGIIGILKEGAEPTSSKDYMVGVQDVRDAFRWYLQNARQERPVVLFGHSQGAMELYEMMKQETVVSQENGFVAAYLIGLPQITREKIGSDFHGRQIAPAENGDDIGVIVVWHIQNADSQNELFTVPNGYCINPLNWRTDATPAGTEENLGAYFYDYRDGSTKSIPHFCGAVLDPQKGAVIVDFPSNSEWDAKGFIGKGVFHMNDIWFFAENLRQNALHRVEVYKECRRDIPGN